MAEESSSPIPPPSLSMPTSLPLPQRHRRSPLPHFRSPHFPHLQSPLPNLHSPPHLPHSPRIRLPSITFDDLEYPGGVPRDNSPRRPWIHNLHLFLDAPRSSTPALWYAIIMLLVIMASTTAFLVSSLPKYYNQTVFKTLQLVAGSIFTADYVLRVATADHWYRWMLRPLSLVDAIVVVPFLISLVPSITVNEQFLALRAVRLLYILKIIRITSYVHMTRVVARTLKKSKDGFIVLLVGVVVMCLFFSTLIFIAENTNEEFDEQRKVWIRKNDGVRSEFQSIFDGVWWCLVTFTTVGYGDVYPISTLGKVVGVFTMFTGVLLTALPVAIFTANFTELWKERKYEKRADMIRRITTPDNEPKSDSKKKKEISALLHSIEKEERHIAAAIQGARESIQEAHNSHKHMQLLLAQLRNSIGSYSSSSAPVLNLREEGYQGDEELEDFQRNSEQSSMEETEVEAPEES